MAEAPITGIDPAIFEHLQNKIDEDVKIRDELRDIVQALERQGRVIQAILSKAHSTPAAQLQPVLAEAEKAIEAQKPNVSRLSEVASQHPYYKYNSTWTRDFQNLVFATVFARWLSSSDGGKANSLMTIDEVGEYFNVPVNLKESDAFHLTIEEYLLALTSLVEELARLAVNSVTLGDYQRPLQISQFVKDLHAGFQLLNLKNDTLRRRSDAIKYSVKKVEDVVYDLSLRNLITRE